MMSSSLSIEGLIHLSLDPSMASNTNQARSRAWEAKDVLSSFDRDKFPSEYKADISINLNRPYGSDPPNQPVWTIQGDLEGTLLQWAVYDDQAMNLIRRMQSPRVLARCFHEKLSRRFKRIFASYDVLDETFDNPQSAEGRISDLADMFRQVVIAAQEDNRYRPNSQRVTVSISVSALTGVCQRDVDPVISAPPTPTAGPTSGHPGSRPEPVPSLFKFTTKIQLPDKSGFYLMLQFLNTCPARILAHSLSDIEGLHALIRDHDSPEPYIRQAGLLLQRAREASPDRDRSELASPAGTGDTSATSPAAPPSSPPAAHNTRTGGPSLASPTTPSTAGPGPSISQSTSAGRAADLEAESNPARAGSKRAAGQPPASVKRGRKEKERRP